MYKIYDDRTIKESIAEISEVLGVDITLRIQSRKYVYARWAFWFMLKSSGCSKSRISRATGFNRQTVQNGLANFPGLIAINDPLAKDYLTKIIDYVDRKRKSK